MNLISFWLHKLSLKTITWENKLLMRGFEVYASHRFENLPFK